MLNKRTIALTLAPLLLLAIPIIGVQTVEGWNWTFFDFGLAGAALAVFGFAFAFISGKGSSHWYKAGVAVAVLGSFLLLWVNAAVGIIGEDNPVNMMYLIVPLVGLAGVARSRFAANGLMRAALAMAVAQLLVPAVAYAIWRPDGISWAPGVAQVFLLSAGFAMPFALSAWLLRRASETERG